uniref:Uncharacterized protein n=1 Tax=Arundo donax TaxID=35708 RepID=A0A0A9D544_ARUDO
MTLCKLYYQLLRLWHALPFLIFSLFRFMTVDEFASTLIFLISRSCNCKF